MLLSIVAGALIGIGAIINLKLGGIAGPIFFSIGLMSILVFKLNLFTGKTGMLYTKEISPEEIGKIWIGNFIGAFGAGLTAAILPIGLEIGEAANRLIQIRNSNTFVENLILGVFCGLLMFIAV